MRWTTDLKFVHSSGEIIRSPCARHACGTQVAARRMPRGTDVCRGPASGRQVEDRNWKLGSNLLVHWVVCGSLCFPSTLLSTRHHLFTMKRSRDDSAAGGKPADSSTGKHKRPKSSQACASCRKHKTRCELLDAHSSSTAPLRLRCHRSVNLS